MLNGGLQVFYQARLALALAAFPIKADVFWPYFTCAILSAIGLTKVIKDELTQKRGLDKLSPFGRLFYAIPMGVFGTEHFTITQQVAGIVPSWMPLHTFWVYLVGTAVIATSLSIILDKHARLAATLFGCMLLLFVILIHIPNLVATHGARLFWVICLRDIAFSGGAFALAARQSKRAPSDGPPRLLTLCRFFVGIPAIVLGVDHFLYPKFTPGIPMEATTPAWIPIHLFWTYPRARLSLPPAHVFW
jgi:uncharacterized membrane protein